MEVRKHARQQHTGNEDQIGHGCCGVVVRFATCEGATRAVEKLHRVPVLGSYLCVERLAPQPSEDGFVILEEPPKTGELELEPEVLAVEEIKPKPKPQAKIERVRLVELKSASSFSSSSSASASSSSTGTGTGTGTGVGIAAREKSAVRQQEEKIKQQLQQVRRGGSSTPTRTAFIGNIYFKIGLDQLRHLISVRAGVKIKSLRLIRHADGSSRGYGYVDCYRVRDTQRIIDTLDGFVLKRRALRVNFAEPYFPGSSGDHLARGAGGRSRSSSRSATSPPSVGEAPMLPLLPLPPLPPLPLREAARSWPTLPYDPRTPASTRASVGHVGQHVGYCPHHGHYRASGGATHFASSMTMPMSMQMAPSAPPPAPTPATAYRAHLPVLGSMAPVSTSVSASASASASVLPGVSLCGGGGCGSMCGSPACCYGPAAVPGGVGVRGVARVGPVPAASEMSAAYYHHPHTVAARPAAASVAKTGTPILPGAGARLMSGSSSEGGGVGAWYWEPIDG